MAQRGLEGGGRKGALKEWELQEQIHLRRVELAALQQQQERLLVRRPPRAAGSSGHRPVRAPCRCVSATPGAAAAARSTSSTC